MQVELRSMLVVTAVAVAVKQGTEGDTREGDFMRHWRWIVVALAVIAMAVLVYPLLQTQKRLRLAQSELARANEQVVQARAGTAELERLVASLKTELDAAIRARTQLQGSLDEARVNQLTADRDTAQSRLSEKQSQLEAMEAELAKARLANAAASKKLTELEANLHQATAEVERLKTALEQKNAAPSQDADSVSPPPIQ